MILVYHYLIPLLWLAWAGYWLANSHDVKASARRESLGSRLMHIIPLAVAAILLWLPVFPVPPFDERFMPLEAWPFWVGTAIIAAGLGFTIWARTHLGRNWSGIVTVKEDHELVTSGPYGLVRHPIYTGLLLAFVGSAVARGEWRGALAVLIVVWALWRKLRMEERWMQERFGAQYDVYRKRVAALVPFLF